MAGARFREAGLNNFRIIEAGGDFGGTWYWNRYPGAQCDIESYCYLPLLEELGYMPKEKYSFAPEIYEHSQRIANTFDLYDGACFQTKVTNLRWDEDIARWIVSTDRNDAMKARFVVMATGPLNRPKLPSVPGIEEFEGHTFHTSRWDYNYTGGDHSGGLTKLADKRVAIIGTGATAIQSVPHVGAHAKHLYVFQRTPSSVDLRGNKPTDPNWAQSLKPGWQRERRENFNAMVTGQPMAEDLVNDGWTEIFRTLASMIPKKSDVPISPEEAALLAELADFKKMNGIRERVDKTVQQARRRRSAEAVVPAVLQAADVQRRISADVQSAERDAGRYQRRAGRRAHHEERRRRERRGVSGRLHHLRDRLRGRHRVDAARRLRHHRPGRRCSLSDYWANGMKTLHGFSSHGFPNCFLMGLSQNGLSVNLTSMLDDQAQHIAYIIKQVMERGARYSHPTAEAEAAWVAEIRRLAINNAAFFEACTPGYYNNEGNVAQRGGGLNGESYAPGANAFNALLAKWREGGKLEGLELG